MFCLILAERGNLGSGAREGGGGLGGGRKKERDS